MPRSSAICASLKPYRLTLVSTSAVSCGTSRSSAAISSIAISWSTNHGSTLVASNSSSAPAPARMACCMVNRRPSCGVRQAARSSSLSPGSPAQVKEAPFFSSERSAFCRASGKDRPIAMASPTDFMWVVRVVSAPENFSNANRGTLTTM